MDLNYLADNPEPSLSVPTKEMSLILKNSEDFRRRISRPFVFRKYLLKQVPLAFISGARLIKLDDTTAKVSIPFRYINKNPFGSMYLNSLAIGAELAGGILVMMYTLNSSPRIRAIIVESNAKYYRKAKSKVYFTSDAGYKIYNTIKYVYSLPTISNVVTKCCCKDKNGENIAEFNFIWQLNPFSR